MPAFFINCIEPYTIRWWFSLIVLVGALLFVVWWTWYCDRQGSV